MTIEVDAVDVVRLQLCSARGSWGASARSRKGSPRSVKMPSDGSIMYKDILISLTDSSAAKACITKSNVSCCLRKLLDTLVQRSALD